MKIEIDKPVIPQYVADWIESLYDEGGSKYDTILIMFEYGTIHDKPVHEWFVQNKDEFITAVMHGYDIQVESLYYAKIKGCELIGDEHEIMYWMFDKPNNSLYVSDTYKFNFPVESYHMHDTKLTIYEWNKLGINDTNADFEEAD